MRGQVRFAYPPLVGANGERSGAGTGRAHVRACVVDDQVGVRQWVVATLEALGFACAVAESAAEGLEVISSQRPDLAVVDSRLPDGRGVDLCRAVSAVHPDITLILHAGMISPADEAEAYDAGVTRVALKTIQGDDLAAAVEEFAQRRGASRD
jgi:DNA-binding NtrC family response regulator